MTWRRAGVWYTDDISVRDSIVEAPKNFRRCRGVTLTNVNFPNAEETLWNCTDVNLSYVQAHGDYFAMNCKNMQLDHFELVGNYSFDGVENMEIHHARMLSKDAFWNSNHVTVYDSFISGEYLGWNARYFPLSTVKLVIHSNMIAVPECIFGKHACMMDLHVFHTIK